MPPLPVIANVFRCALEWTAGAAGDAVNVIHVAATSPPATPLQVFTCIDTHVTRTMFDLQSDSAVVQGISITPLDGASATSSFSTGSPAKWSGNGGAGPTPAVANLIKLGTGLRGRSRRGRIFLPFVAEGEMANGRGDVTATNTVNSAWQAFAAALAADATTPLALGVASYKNSDFFGATLIQAETVLATQRRRQTRLR